MLPAVITAATTSEIATALLTGMPNENRVLAARV